MRKTFVISALVIGTAVQLFAAQSPLTLVRDGEAQSVIVTADKPSSSARYAARDLQMWIEKTGGAKLAIRRESDVRPSDGVRVLIGASEATAKLGIDLASFELEEIRIRTYPDILVLMGDDKRPDGVALKGTVWAVGAFAEQRLGVRVLWPGELGLVVPKKSTIEIGELDFRFVPVLRKRTIRNIGYSDRIQRGLDKLGWSADEFKRHARESDIWFRFHRIGGSFVGRYGHAYGKHLSRFSKASQAGFYCYGPIRAMWGFEELIFIRL